MILARIKMYICFDFLLARDTRVVMLIVDHLGRACPTRCSLEHSSSEFTVRVDHRVVRGAHVPLRLAVQDHALLRNQFEIKQGVLED